MRRSHLMVWTAAAVLIGLSAWAMWGRLPAQEKPAPAGPSVRWEYKAMHRETVIRTATPDWKSAPIGESYDSDLIAKGLTRLAEDGWELTAIETWKGYGYFYLKRPRPAK